MPHGVFATFPFGGRRVSHRASAVEGLEKANAKCSAIWLNKFPSSIRRLSPTISFSVPSSAALILLVCGLEPEPAGLLGSSALRQIVRNLHQSGGGSALTLHSPNCFTQNARARCCHAYAVYRLAYVRCVTTSKTERDVLGPASREALSGAANRSPSGRETRLRTCRPPHTGMTLVAGSYGS